MPNGPMQQSTSNDTPSPLDPYIAALLRQAGANNAPQPTQPGRSPSQPMYLNAGGAMVPLDPSRFSSGGVDPAADLKTVESYLPENQPGPYTSTPSGEAQTAREYQSRLNSPYMLFGSDNPWAAHHPRVAGALDNAFLAGSLINEAHQKSVAAGGGVEGAGGAVGDVLSSLLGMPQARLAYRQNLENIALQHEQAEAQLGSTQAGTLQHLMGALSAYESNPARILEMANRGIGAAALGGTSREDIANLNNATRIFTSLHSDATKQAIAHLRAVSGTSAAAREHVQSSFLNGINQQIGRINAQFDKLENSPVVENGLSRPRTKDEISQLEAQRQSEIESEMAFGEGVSQQAWGRNLLSLLPQQPGTPAPSTLKPSAMRLPQGGGKTLSNKSIWNQFLRAAGGNSAKAEKLARKNGWR